MSGENGEWEYAVAYIKAFSMMYEENKTRTFKAMKKNEKWLNEELEKIAKEITEAEGTENSKGEKELTIGNLHIKLQKDGTLKYINYGGDYVLSSFGRDGAFIDKVESLEILYNHIFKSIEKTHVIEELKEKIPRAIEEYNKQVLPSAQDEKKELDRMAQELGKFLVDTFGYCKGRNCYYITDLKDGERKRTLEIKVENGSMKYIKLGNDYIVSQYGFSQREEYAHLIELMHQHIEKKVAEFQEQKKKAIVSLPEGIGKEVKQYRDMLTNRVKEIATKLAVWYGLEESNGNYVFNSTINYNGEEEQLKIKIEKGELKYVKVGDRYIYADWGGRPYMSWLLNAHNMLYRELMRRVEGTKVEMEKEEFREIPAEAVIKKEAKVNVEDILGNFEVEEGRIMLPLEYKVGNTITRKVLKWKDGTMEIWDNFKMKEVKTRAEHYCEICGKKIEKGETALVYTERTRRGNYISKYYCKEEYKIEVQEIKISASASEEERGSKTPDLSL